MPHLQASAESYCGCPVAYASRSLPEAESRNAQTEKELLAVEFSLLRFNQYTYGKKVPVESNHKPQEKTLKKPLSTVPPRLQRILLRMQKYDYTLEYKPEGSYYSQTYCPVHQFLKQQNDNNMEEEKCTPRSSDTVKPTTRKTQTWRKTRGNSQRRVADTPQWNHQTWMARNRRLSQ